MADPYFKIPTISQPPIPGANGTRSRQPTKKISPRALEALVDQTSQTPAAGGGRLSPLDDLAHVPVLTKDQHEIFKLKLDDESLFLLALVDGQRSYEEILAMCNLERHVALESLARMVALDLISLTSHTG